MSQRPPMNKFDAANRLKSMLDIVLLENAAAGAGRMTIDVRTEADRVLVRIRSDAVHRNGAETLRTALAAGRGVLWPAVAVQLSVTAAHNDTGTTWTGHGLGRATTTCENAADGGAGTASWVTRPDHAIARVHLEYRTEDDDAGATAARAAAESARYTPAAVTINHAGAATETGNDDYLDGAVSRKTDGRLRIGVMRSTGKRPEADRRGGFVYLGREILLFPDTVDALDGSHYHARIVLNPKRTSRAAAAGMDTEHKRRMLREAGMTAVLEHLKTQAVPHRIQRTAANRSIEIPDPPVRLGRWAPAIADASWSDDREATRETVSLPYRKPAAAVGAGPHSARTVIVRRTFGTHPAAEQLIAIALKTENRLRTAAGQRPVVLAAENHDLTGYPEYDRLPYVQPEMLDVRKMTDPSAEQLDETGRRAHAGPARPGWTVRLPVMEDDSEGGTKVTDCLHLASPVRYKGRTTGRGLQRREKPRGTATKGEQLKLTIPRGEDTEA